jgi:hypothetical protein
MTWIKFRAARRGFKSEKPSMPKSLEGLRKLCELSIDSLAVFYVEQVCPKSPRDAA